MAHDTSPTPDAQENTDLLTSNLDFSVVGLAASARGVAALELFPNPCASRLGHGLRGGDAPFAQAQNRLEGFDASTTQSVDFDVLRKTVVDVALHAVQESRAGTDPDAGADTSVFA